MSEQNLCRGIGYHFFDAISIELRFWCNKAPNKLGTKFKTFIYFSKNHTILILICNFKDFKFAKISFLGQEV